MYFCDMEKIRQSKVANLILQEIAKIFLINGASWVSGKLLTVTKVRVTPDLLEAKIHISIFPSKDSDKALEQIKLHSSEVRNKLGQALRNALRRIPNLSFFVDNSLDYAERIDDLLKD